MPRFLKGSPEAKAWGEKMKAARERKTNNPPEAKIEVPKQEPAFMVDIIKGFFPEAGLKIQDRGNDYSVEILIKEGDIRAFTADKLTAKIETENWCGKIKANIEGRPLNAVAGTNLMTGAREEMKKMPPNLGKEEEFFFRE